MLALQFAYSALLLFLTTPPNCPNGQCPFGYWYFNPIWCIHPHDDMGRLLERGYETISLRVLSGSEFRWCVDDRARRALAASVRSSAPCGRGSVERADCQPAAGCQPAPHFFWIS
jgi:hypothetical protein